MVFAVPYATKNEVKCRIICGVLMGISSHFLAKIDGVEYPVRQTMAALVDFREATGKEAYEITGL